MGILRFHRIEVLDAQSKKIESEIAISKPGAIAFQPNGDLLAVSDRNLVKVDLKGDFTYQQSLITYGSTYVLREPRKTFRFTVSTTF